MEDPATAYISGDKSIETGYYQYRSYLSPSICPPRTYLPPAMSQKPVSICEKSAYIQPTSVAVALAAAHPRCVDKDFDQLVDTFRRLMNHVLLDQGCRISASKPHRPVDSSNINHTSTCSNSLRVVVGNIVVDPSEILVRFLRRVCRLQVLQPASDHTIPEQTRKEGDLQGEPVLRLPDIEDVAAVCRASC